MKLDNANATITVQSSNIDLGGILPNYARNNILRVASKYFGRLTRASVHFNREGGSYRCTINMQMSGAKPVTGEALDGDCYLAFTMALNKAAKQLRRRKREVREDKGQRLDKDMVLREALGARPAL